MPLSESNKRKLDALVMKMEAANAPDEEIREVVADFVEVNDEPADPARSNIERAVTMAIDAGKPAHEIKYLQALHPDVEPDQRKSMIEDSMEMAKNALPAGDRYQVAGLIDMNQNTAEVFEMLFPYATSSMKKGAPEEEVGMIDYSPRVGAGAYSDVSSLPMRTLVGLGEQAYHGAKNLVTGENEGPTLRESIGDINRENVVTSALTAPGTIESMATGGVLAKGVGAGLNAASKAIPYVSQAQKFMNPAVKFGEKAFSKIPGMTAKGVQVPGKTAPLIDRAAKMMGRGAVSAVPSAATQQVKKYSETGELDPIEAGLEVAAGAVMDPAFEEVGKAALKGGKTLAKAFLEKASGRSEDLLEYVGLEELKEGVSKKIRGTDPGPLKPKPYESKKLDKIREFGKKADELGKDMVDKLDNFHEYYIADPANVAYEAIHDLDLINIKPIRNSLYEAKAELAPAVHKYSIEMGKGDFVDGKVPVGHKFGVPTIDAQMAKIDELITLTGKPGQVLEKTNELSTGAELVDISKVRKKLASQKLTPTGWKKEIGPEGVPVGHKFGDTKIDSHNRKLDQLILQFGNPAGSPAQQKAKETLKAALEGGKDIPATLTNQAFDMVEKIGKKDNYWPKAKVAELQKMNYKLGDKTKNKALDDIFTDTKVYTEDMDLWPADQVLRLRNNVEGAIKFDANQHGSDYASQMERLKKKTRHDIKEELVSAAERSGKKEYIDAMEELHDKMDIKEQLFSLMDSRNEWAGMERYQRFLLSLGDKNKEARHGFVEKLKKLTGHDIMADNALLRLGAEYQDNMPVFNPTPTGVSSFVANMLEHPAVKFGSTVMTGPKRAAMLYGGMNEATPFVKGTVDAARMAAPVVATDQYNRGNQ